MGCGQTPRGPEERADVLDRHQAADDADEWSFGGQIEARARQRRDSRGRRVRLYLDADRDDTPAFGGPDAELEELVADVMRYGNERIRSRSQPPFDLEVRAGDGRREVVAKHVAVERVREHGHASPSGRDPPERPGLRQVRVHDGGTLLAKEIRDRSERADVVDWPHLADERRDHERVRTVDREAPFASALTARNDEGLEPPFRQAGMQQPDLACGAADVEARDNVGDSGTVAFTAWRRSATPTGSTAICLEHRA